MKQYDEETGECWDIPAGSLILTPEDLAVQQDYRNRRSEAAKRQEELAKYHYRGSEKYYFVSAAESLDLPSKDATRLIFLLTYLGYDGVLKTTSRTEMKRSDLSNLLNVSQDTADRFWKKVSNKFLYENERRTISVNEDWFIRGKLQERQFTEYQQFYDTSIRRLYMTATTGALKKMGYIFKMLPWINREFNILSDNPTETDIELVKPMSIDDFCYRAKLDRSNISRLLKDLGSIRFVTKGKEERFCSIVYSGRDIESAKIVINPSILYVGKNFNRVEVYRLFFKDD